MDRDTATGVVGALVRLAAMAGVFFYERAQFSEHDVTWEQQTAVSEAASGTLEEGESAEGGPAEASVTIREEPDTNQATGRSVENARDISFETDRWDPVFG